MSTSEYTNPAHAESADTAVDADAVARAKREIQVLIQEIADLARSDVAPEEFYDVLLNKVVAALAAPGGAVWMRSDAGMLQLVYQINLRETGLVDNPVGQTQHARLLQQVMLGTDGALIAPHSGHSGGTDSDDQAAANPTDFLLVMGPVHNDQGPQGVVEVFQRSGARPPTQRGYLRFLLQTCELAGDYLRLRRLRHLSDKQTLWEQLESFTRLAHEKLDVRQTAYTIANEGRRLIGCDRVSVAIQRGRRCPVEAISGQDTFDKRSNISVLLSKVARSVTKTGDDVWYTGDTSDLAPQVEKALDAYVDESHTKAMAILPLTEPRDEEDLRTDRKPAKVVGALIVEQMVDSRLPEGFIQRVDVVRNHSATALTNAMEYEGLFLMPVWRALGKATRLFRGKTLPKTLLVLTAVTAVVAAACLVPYDFALQGDGRLRPKERARVFAAVGGEVRRLHVLHDQPVQKDDLLLEMESPDLDAQLVDVQGQLKEVLAQKRAMRRPYEQQRESASREIKDRYARIAELETQRVSLEQQKGLLEHKKERLKIYSPIDGHVITWEVRERLQGRTVAPGDELMKIADPSGDWELEVEIPESRWGYVQQAMQKSGKDLEVSFILTTHPAERGLKGRLVEVDMEADVRNEEGNTVLVRVEFDQDELRKVVAEPKVNATATAKVHCGKQPIGFVMLYSLFDAVRKHILFRFGW